MTYSCVVVGTDGSATAERAVRQAAEVASTESARLIVVTAYEGHHRTGMEHLAGTGPGAESQRQAEAPGDLRWMLTDRGQAEGIAQHGRDLAREAGAKDIVIQSDEGDPAAVLVVTAEFYDADLLVVGSVGLVGPQRFLLGSVASAVLHHAPCDVLVVDTD